MTPQLRRAWGVTPARIAGRIAAFLIAFAGLAALATATVHWAAAELARVMEALP